MAAHLYEIDGWPEIVRVEVRDDRARPVLDQQVYPVGLLTSQMAQEDSIGDRSLDLMDATCSSIVGPVNLR